VRACAVHDAERAGVEDSVADVAVEVVEIRLTVLIPVLYHQEIEIGPGESREKEVPGSTGSIH